MREHMSQRHNRRRLKLSMVMPLSVYPRTWQGILAVLQYRNWLVNTKYVDRQVSDSLPSNWVTPLID